jgi:ubiquinone/menaquinone biosynthesis C-methylase UbiE
MLRFVRTPAPPLGNQPVGATNQRRANAFVRARALGSGQAGTKMPEKELMTESEPRNQQQSELWNGPSGQAWVQSQQLMDQLLRPFEDLLLEATAAEPCQSLLDVGCGTGGTTLALARRLGSAVRCTGVDISEPMLELARARAEREATPPAFIAADAQTHAFEPGSFDAIVSRFGIMFFDDPVQAFANLHTAAKPGARLLLVAWRSAAENPFMTTAERAAAPWLPELPSRRPDEPGQFAFADPDRVRQILKTSGWTNIELTPVDLPCSMPERDLAPYVTRFGPVGRVLQKADAATRANLLDRIRDAMAPYVDEAEVRITCACWLIRASS